MTLGERSIRDQVVAARKSLTPSQIEQRSEQAVHRFLGEIKVLGSLKNRRIALYRAMPSELSLKFLESFFLKSGAKLHYPRVKNPNEKALELVEVADPDTAIWHSGFYGIQEPPPGLEPIDPSTLDIVWVPGVAFGISGERIGMGAGYYDRLLSKCPQAVRVSLAFDFQLFEKLNQESWDQPVDWILTEKRDINRLGKRPGIRGFHTS